MTGDGESTGSAPTGPTGPLDLQLANERLRRRAAELEALYSTARELVRLQDVDEVLARLVERAHALMGTDVTYLSETEADAGLRVRHSAGTVTAGFRDLRVPAGYGLASLVATSRAPAWVASYASMDDAPHDAHIDAAVAAEGLVSFLGVPLAVGDEVLGALFACNRFAHEYSPDEVLLLSAFADHAAAVLHTARVLAATEAATARAEQAVHELELAAAVHDELTAAVMSGGTVIDIVATLSRRMGRRVTALDGAGRSLLAHAAAELPPTGALGDALARSRSSGRAEPIVDGVRNWLVVAIPGADRLLGAILAEGSGGDGEPDVGSGADTEADRTDRRILERAAQVAALVSFKQEAVSSARAERRARWLLDLVEGRDADPAAGPDAFSGCALLDLAGHGAGQAAVLADRAAGDDGIVAPRDGRLVIAWTTPDVLAATERVRGVLADALREPDLAAAALVRRLLPAELRGAVERTTRDLELLPALGVRGATVSSDAFTPYHGLAPTDPAALERFLDELLGPVLAWDERRGTDLFATLASWFEQGESRGAVAEALHIHANTVQQRLERVQTLLAGDLGDAEYRFRVHSAVRLEQLRRGVRASAASAERAGGRDSAGER